MALTASKLREDIYRVLDQVLATGEPVEILRGGRLLRIVAVDGPDAHGTGTHPRREGVIVGDPEDLVGVDWSDEWRP